MEDTDQNQAEGPIRPPDPSSPWDKFEPFLKSFYRLKESKGYMPLLAAVAFVVGYFLFIAVANLEETLNNPNSFVDFPDRTFLQMAIIEQAVLGIAVFILLAVSRTYQLTLFLYAGFLTYPVQLITGRMTPGDTLLVLLTPVFIYGFTGLLLTLGLMFNKKLGVLFLVLNILLLAQHNVKTFTGENLDLKKIFYPARSEPLEAPETLTQVSELQTEEAGADIVAESAETSPIVWRSLDARSQPIRTLHNSDLNSNFCFFTIGDIVSGQYTGKTVTLITVQVDFPCDVLRPLKSYGYVVADKAGNVIAWKDDYLYFQYEEECEDPFDYGGACNPANYRRYLGLLDSSIDALPFPSEFTKLTKGYIFTETSPNRASFRIVDRDFYTLFPFNPSNTADAAFQLIDSTKGDAKIVRKTNTVSALTRVLPDISYYLLLPFGRALLVASVPDFMNEGSRYPKVIWSRGNSRVSQYSYGLEAKGWQGCFTNITAEQFRSALIETGATDIGAPVYETDPLVYTSPFSCLQRKILGISDDQDISRAVSAHLMFFWKDPYGDMIPFLMLPNETGPKI